MMNVTVKDYGLQIRLDNYIASMDASIQRGLKAASIQLERHIVRNVSGRSHSQKTFRADTGQRTTRRVRDKETGTYSFRTVRVMGTFANTNPYIGVVSGDLRRGITHRVERHVAHIGVLADIPYAAIHEFGGTITQNRGGRIVQIKIPKRSYVRPAFDAERDTMLELLKQHMLKGLTR